MANAIVRLPLGYFPDPNKGRPLGNAKIYVGVVDLDPRILANQLTVTGRQESGAEVSLPQPIRTSFGGVPVDANGNVVTLLVDGAYAMAVDSNKSVQDQKYYFANVLDGSPLTFDNGIVGYNSLSEAILSAAFYIGNRVYTASYRSKDECNALSVSYPDGGGANYIVETLSSPDEYGNHTVGAMQLSLVNNGNINAKQFGAIDDDGATNNLLSLGAFVASTPNDLIYVTSIDGGQYAVTSGTLVIPATCKIQYSGDSRIYASGTGIVTNNGTSLSILGAGPSGTDSALARGIDIELHGNTGTATNSTLALNRIVIEDDDIDASPDANGTKVDGLLVLHNFGGPLAAGGRHAIEGVLLQNAVTAAVSPDRFYVGVAGLAQTTTGDGGTGGTGLGAYFGGNFVANNLGGKWIANMSGIEINTTTTDNGGDEINYHSGIQIVSGHKKRGYTIDAAIAISNKSASTTTWANGIRFGSMNGSNPLGIDSKMIVCTADTTIADALVLPECTGQIIDSGDVSLTNVSLTLASVNSFIEIGSQSAVGSSRFEMYSSGNPNDYDARIICQGGNATAGNGSISIEAVETKTRAMRPLGDNLYALGTASNRWSVVYSATGAIDTSDERSKQQVQTITDKERLVSIELRGMIKKFKFNDSVKDKGESARWHFGVMAQQVVKAFSRQGLDANEYGIVCLDKLGEELDDVGEIIPTGERYGIRYSELICFIIASM